MFGTKQYSDDLTPEEKELGFELMEVANPEAEDFGFTSPKVKAVLYRLGPSDRVIKLHNEGGKPSYQHQRFGSYGSSEKKDWKPAQIPVPNPVMAIRLAKSSQIDTTSPKITPHDPGDKY